MLDKEDLTGRGLHSCSANATPGLGGWGTPIAASQPPVSQSASRARGRAAACPPAAAATGVLTEHVPPLHSLCVSAPSPTPAPTSLPAAHRGPGLLPQGHHRPAAGRRLHRGGGGPGGLPAEPQRHRQPAGGRRLHSQVPATGGWAVGGPSWPVCPAAVGWLGCVPCQPALDSLALSWHCAWVRRARQFT